VLTFPTAQTSLVASDFTIAGFTVNSASWAGAVLTLVVSRVVTFLDLSLTITFVKTGTTTIVTNNVTADNLLAYYDNVQGANPLKLYDKSGNGKDGDLYATAPPSFGVYGTIFTGTEKITIPALKAGAAPFSVIVGYKQSVNNATLGQLFISSGIFYNYFFESAPGVSKYNYQNTWVIYSSYPSNNPLDWQIFTFVLAAPTIKVYKNGICIFVSAIATDLAINGTIELSRIGFKGTNGISAFFGKALSDIEQLAIYRSLAAKLKDRGVTNINDTTISVICDGDSITYGSYASDWYHSYPEQLRALNPKITTHQFGAGGQKIETMLANAATVVDPLYMATGVEKSVVVCWGGSNDIAVFSRTDTQTYNDIVSYCSGRQAAGFKVIILTIMPRTDCTGGEETYRQSVNTSIRANWAIFADALADVAADTRLDDFNDTTYYYSDKIHLIDAGYAAVAELINNAISSL